MRTISFFIIVCFFAACGASSEKKTETKQVVEETTEHEATAESKTEQTLQEQKNDNLPKVKLTLNDTSVVTQYKRLQRQFPTIPFFTFIDNVPYFYVSNQATQEYGANLFSNQLQFGLINETDTLIPVKYNKIYNLDHLKKGFVEVRTGDKVGLYAYAYRTVLEPEFDYLFPAQAGTKAIAIGVKGMEQYEIHFDGNSFSKNQISFNFSKALKQMNILDMKNHLYINTKFEQLRQDDPDPAEGRGVLITSSFAETQLQMEPMFTSLVASGQTNYEFGTTALKANTEQGKTVSGRISSFFLHFWHSGVDARDFASEKVDVVIYDNENNQFSKKNILEFGANGELCNTNKYVVKNDTLIEIVQTTNLLRYTWAPGYRYMKVSPNGTIEEIKSNRTFPFTKFVAIDETYFQGCMGRSATQEELDGDDSFNVFNFEHLSIEDLDVMRNEIFAEYGYRFKTPKWQEYFGKFDWYEPAFDNVDDKLSELEKENIKVILKRKKEMEGKEEEFTKKQKGMFIAAG